MATVRPFRALRPEPANAARVSVPPYDVINSAEARALSRGNVDSFLRVTRPEVDLPDSTDEHDDLVYARGGENLRDFVRRGVLRPDPRAHFYVYAQRMGDHRQVGLVACASVDEYVNDTIKKHEKTRADKEDDRTRHIDTLAAHDEPVFLTYRASAAIDERIGRVTSGTPTYDFTSDDGVAHTLWVLPEESNADLEAAFRVVPALYVADGHHRSAAAARVHAQRQDKPGEHGVFMCVLFPHDQMQIMAYNRVVRDVRGRSPAELLQEIARRMDVSPADAAAPTEPRTVGVFCDGRWWRARARAGSYAPSDPVGSLDCSIVQDQVLAPIFGITDPRRDSNVDFVGGIRGAVELERRVRAQQWSLALHLYPTSIEQLMAVSDAGLLMPPKSTWFEPKLRSGLFVHDFGA